MVKWLLRIGGALVLVLGILFWWLLLSGSNAVKSAPDTFDISEWRSKAAGPQDTLPTSIRIIEIGHDSAPAFAALAGRFGSNVAMSYNAVEISYPDRKLIVGGAVDRATAEEMKLSEADWAFSETAYAALLADMLTAEQVLMTHEHLDHVMAIARHPEAAALATNLVLNAPQISALPLFADGALDPALAGLTPRLSGDIEAVAPGVVIVPAAGHTPGSLMVFISLQNGEEILLIGDIVWTMDAIEELKTRPVLTQYIAFAPNYEDRQAIKEQVRALHDMMEASPDLTVLAAHDRAHLIQSASVDGISFESAD